MYIQNNQKRQAQLSLLRGFLMISIAAVMSGCATQIPNEPETPSVTSQIVNSVSGTWNHAVVRIQVDDWSLCTGTFINPRVILSSANCLKGNGRQTLTAWGWDGMGFEPAINRHMLGKWGVTVHSYGNFSTTQNLALAVLDQPLHGAITMNLSQSRPPANDYFKYKFLGWREMPRIGQTSLTISTYTAVWNQRGRRESGLCYGDFGGPLLSYSSSREIAGVASDAEIRFDRHCVSRGSDQRWTTVYDKLPWIKQTLFNEHKIACGSVFNRGFSCVDYRGTPTVKIVPG